MSTTTTTTKSSNDHDCEVVVVGAGLAGLTTAYRIASLKPTEPSDKKPKVILCDAWEIGGRTKSRQMDEKDTNDKVSVGGK